ncbi:MAG: right-handed parallel beta-helix repeat-containing protein [Flavobacteriales bacterium]|nr:right-handed parallel beta-helix repeat-containing protein [Flavobacteriales bacterium]
MSLLVWWPTTGAFAQVLPPERSTDWSRAGLQGPPPDVTTVLDITDFGGMGDGVTSNDAALTAALDAAQGQMSVVRFPPGDFLFTATIQLHDSVVLRGATADSTTLIFDLGGSGYCITAVGWEGTTSHPLDQSAARGDTLLWTTSVQDLQAGDLIRLHRDDSLLVTSPWAIGTTGQLVKIAEVHPDRVGIASPLRAFYPLSGTPDFHVVHPIRQAGIECLKVVRMDAAPPDEWSNILFARASNCWVRGVESDHCNFAHVELFVSTNCEITGCHFHHAFAYGGNGQGYGVMTYCTSGENLISNNIFVHLRHAMVVQAGANGNVFAYNLSVDPYWDEFPFPTNSAGDIVLHGDHPYLNLFESNVVSNIVVDASHGTNGPFNTFFRDRTELYGLVAVGAPATDSLNILGNEITGSPGLYSLNGVGHFEYGNLVQGTIVPAGTGGLTDPSCYATSIPDLLMSLGGWPQIGPNSVPPGSIPAAERWADGTGSTICSGAELPTIVHPDPWTTGARCHPMPFSGSFLVETGGMIAGEARWVLMNAMGAAVRQGHASMHDGSVTIEGLADLPAGVYLLVLREGERTVMHVRIMKCDPK